MAAGVAYPVLRMGHPVLRQRAREITEFGTPALAALVAAMEATMVAEGGVGLAAPQIGVGLRLVVFGFDSSERYPEAPAIPFTVLLNPHLEPIGTEEEEGWEGCLSLPGMRGWVPRWKRLRYRGFTPDGQPLERVVEGFHARVVQHECDHLDGLLYPARIRDFSRFGFIEELFPEGPAAGAED